MWPTGHSVWNPSAKSLNFLAIAKALPILVISFFKPNLNLIDIPELLPFIVSLIWLISFVIAIVKAKNSRPVIYAVMASSFVLFMVSPEIIAPRHLLILYPLSCIILADGIAMLKKQSGNLLIFLLLLSGGVVQINEMYSPYIYGPEPQHRGISRSEIKNMIKTLNEHNVKYVYCSDPMLQWNIIFESREKIIARWVAPKDRISYYPALVDQALHSGKPVALISNSVQQDKKGSQSYQIILNPDREIIKKYFPSQPVRNQFEDFPDWR